MSKPATATTEAQQSLGLIKVSRQTIEDMRQNGLTAETIGIGRIYNGSVLVTFESGNAIKENLVKKILETDDPIAKATLANAFANIVKSEASTIKAVGGVPGAQPEGAKRPRKSFAPAAPIDINPKA